MRRLVAPLLLLYASSMAIAQTSPVVLSSAPQAVGVTLYRDPDRGEGEMDRDDPSSFALIAETRTITLPPGVATIRFEGVASGIVPQSAIMFGTDPRERNRDAALLSQAGLVDSFTGQRVVLRRTDPATGEIIEERATIRSAADRLIIDTPRGAEAVYCSGLAQTLIYPGAPATLAAKPVLSMTTKDQPGGTVTITLAYIATGFDWDATYVGTLDETGARLDLFAWLTMASADETNFVDATTAAVAGRINRSDETRDDSARAAISAARQLNKGSQCWPAGTTSDVPDIPIPPPPSMPMMMEMAGGDIVVTGAAVRQRAMPAPMAITAEAENLSDLKLYRVPIPVTVAAKSQKQVAFLADRRIDGSLIYRSRLYRCEPDDPEMLFRFRNRKRDGLGEPLPAGKVILYQMGARGRQLVGETTLLDKTLDEEVDLVFGDAQGVRIDTDSQPAKGGTLYTVTVRNAHPFPVSYEMEFTNDPDAALHNVSKRLTGKPGKRIWTAALAPNSEAKISYMMSECP